MPSVASEQFIEEYGKDIAGGSDEGGMEALLSKRPRAGEKRKPPPPLPHWTPAMVGKVVGQRLAAKSGRVQKLFRAADKDHSGSLSHDEFRRLLDGLNIQVRRIASRSPSRG